LLTCKKFIKALQHFGFEYTKLEEQLLIYVIDPGKTGTVDYLSLLSYVKSNVKIVEPATSLAEKTRAMEYILLSQNANANILDYLQFEIIGDSTRLAWFKCFHSLQYNLFVVVGILLNLSLAFAEAPASRLHFITKENIESHRQTVFFLRALSCLFLFVDLAFEVWLFRLYKVDEIAFEAGIGLSSRSKKKINLQIIIQCSLFLFFVIDLFAVYSTGVKNGDTANTQIVYLLPYSACFRAVWPIVRFRRLKYTFIIFVKTMERAKIVFLVLLFTLISFSVMGTALFANRHGYNSKDSFQTVYHGFFTLFTFMISSENYLDVTHPPALCDGSKDANTLKGGLMTAECFEASHNTFNIFATLTGTFLIVSLVISVFSDTYIRLIAKQRQEDKKISRMALIAAFIILDKDSSGKLDKNEFLNFFNSASHTGRIFYVDDGFQLSGRNFFDLCEEVLHEMELIYPKGISSVEFAPTKSFASCTPSELFQFLSTLSIDGFPTDYSSIGTDTDSIVEYWRWRGCDYYQEQLRVEDHKTYANNIRGRKQYMQGLNVTSKAVKIVSKGIVALNICVLCLYGCFDNVEVLDALCLISLFLQRLEIMYRIYIHNGFFYFMRVNEDFFLQVRNQTDFFIVFLSFTGFIVLLATRLPNGNPIFYPWQRCTSETACEANDFARIILAFSSLRIFSLSKRIREVVYCFYVIVPNYVDIIILTLLILYMYAVLGCSMFGGAFKYLHGYESPQSNFNSMVDALFTLFQMFTGEGWNNIMSAGINTVGSSSSIAYCYSYIFVTGLLLTNLLVGIMINGFSYIDKILRKAKQNNLRKYPTKIIVKSLEQGKMHINTLAYSYCAEKSAEVKIVHNKAVANPAKLDVAADEQRANSSRWIENFNFDNFMTFLRDSKDSYGFYTTYTSTVLSQFYEAATESESIKFYNRRQNNDPTRKSISRQRRKSVGTF
jgi:hypothetical protein